MTSLEKCKKIIDLIKSDDEDNLERIYDIVDSYDESESSNCITTSQNDRNFSKNTEDSVIFSNAESSNHKNKQNLRYRIMLKGIDNLDTLNAINSKLKDEGLREIYIRDIREFIIYLCCLQNEKSNDYNIRLDEFRAILISLESTISKLITTTRSREDIDYFNKKSESIRCLKEFLDRNSKDVFLETKSVTLKLRKHTSASWHPPLSVRSGIC